MRDRFGVALICFWIPKRGQRISSHNHDWCFLQRKLFRRFCRVCPFVDRTCSINSTIFSLAELRALDHEILQVKLRKDSLRLGAMIRNVDGRRTDAHCENGGGATGFQRVVPSGRKCPGVARYYSLLLVVALFWQTALSRASKISLLFTRSSSIVT